MLGLSAVLLFSHLAPLTAAVGEDCTGDCSQFGGDLRCIDNKCFQVLPAWEFCGTFAGPFKVCDATKRLACVFDECRTPDAGFGEVCGGDTGTECAGSGTDLFCLRDDGTFPLFRRETGRCAFGAGFGDSCDPANRRFCVGSATVPFSDPNRQPRSLPMKCLDGACKVDPVGVLGFICAPETGVVCGGPDKENDECEDGEGALSCELVTGFPGADFHCVTKDIPVGGSCLTGIGTPVNVKIFEKCVEGARCAFRGRFAPGECVADQAR